MKNKWGFYIGLLMVGVNACAYHLDDHSAITHQAFQELTKCFPKSEALLNVEWLVSGNLGEDTDLFTKWLFFSHYYNPNKKLDMRREDSAARVLYLTRQRQRPAKLDVQEMTSLGQMIHHFQDATVPAHVTPVEHAMWDGFESYKIDDFASDLNCSQIEALEATDPLVILKETAQATLNNIKAFSFVVLAEVLGQTNQATATGQAFWQESNDNEFGAYGYLGNNFGEHEFDKDGAHFQVALETYDSFKRQQMQLAVVATLRGLMWELGDQLALKKNSCLEK